jgi:(p)ppGpp synthase/HD superfamily hydrolase
VSRNDHPSYAETVHTQTFAAETTGNGVPTFSRDFKLTETAVQFARRFHRGQRRDSDRAPFILHPLEVASLLYSCGASDEVVAAGVLHDVVENTSVDLEQINATFGPRIEGLVAAVTENPKIRSERARKAALRKQVRGAGADAAAIFAADKLAKLRELRTRVAHARLDGAPLPADTRKKIGHYTASLKMLEQVLAGHSLVRQLRFELEAFRAFPPGRPLRPAAQGAQA